jgi:hypothetical protein
MTRTVWKRLFGGRRTSSSPKDAPPSSTSSAGQTEDEGVGPVDPLDPMKREREFPGADPVVPPIPPEV